MYRRYILVKEVIKMPVTIRISFNETDFQHLSQKAIKQNMSVQDFIRQAVCEETNESIFTPEEAVKRALKKKKENETFYLSDLYDAQEWCTLSRGDAGVFGRRFYTYVQQAEINIEFLGMVCRKAKYTIKGGK